MSDYSPIDQTPVETPEDAPSAEPLPVDTPAEAAPLIPVPMQRILALVLTMSAALLYAIVMGYAILKTMAATEPFSLNANMIRAAGALGGLVGSIVTAGFASSQRPISMQLAARHPIGGSAVSNWGATTPPSRARLKMWSLANVLGVDTMMAPPTTKGGELVQEPVRAALASWVAVGYVIIYLAVGMASLLVSLIVDFAPDMLAQAGWVWLGTAVTTSYSFFGLDNR